VNNNITYETDLDYIFEENLLGNVRIESNISVQNICYVCPANANASVSDMKSGKKLVN
jgi:hypothetical protein